MTFAPLKSRCKRRAEYWFATPQETVEWIKQVRKDPCHPTTLGHRWRELLESVGLEYRFHDLRHTWTTNALEVKSPREVQLCAGHADISTTMRYAHDKRELDDTPLFDDEDVA